MNGATSLVQILLASDTGACFASPVKDDEIQ